MEWSGIGHNLEMDRIEDDSYHSTKWNGKFWPFQAERNRIHNYVSGQNDLLPHSYKLFSKMPNV